MSIKNLKLAKAENAVMSHDWKTAARLYKDLLVGNESNIEYLKALGSIFVKSGQDEKAIPYYEQIITFHPHDVDAMNSLGGIYRRLKRFDESIEVLQRAKDEKPGAGNVNYNLGFTYKEMGNYEDAIDSFETVIEDNPSDVLAYNHLGSIYYSMKKYDQSVIAFKKGLQVDPNHPILNYNLAHCYEAMKSIPEAIHCYEKTLKTRPGWVDAIRDFSELLINCQQTTQAQELIEQSIKLYPMDTDLLCLLGKIYLYQNDYESSADVYKKAEAIKGDDVKILTGMAKALEKQQRVNQALDKVTEAVDIEPENRDIRKQYAHTLLSAQHYDQALDNINELYNDKGDKDPQLLDLYGQYFICRGNEEVAKFYYEKIKKLNHQYKDYILEAADRFIQTGDYENAEKYAKDFINTRPQQPEGYTNLGRVYNAQGKLKEAKDEYKRSVSLKRPNIFADKEIARIQNEIDNHPEIYNPPVIEKEEPVEEEVEEEEVAEEPVEEEQEEEFDFTQMGDDVVSDEDLLSGDEEDFWDSFDDEEEEPGSNALEDTLVEPEPEFEEEQDKGEETGPDMPIPSFIPMGNPDGDYGRGNQSYPANERSDNGPNERSDNGPNERSDGDDYNDRNNNGYDDYDNKGKQLVEPLDEDDFGSDFTPESSYKAPEEPYSDDKGMPEPSYDRPPVENMPKAPEKPEIKENPYEEALMDKLDSLEDSIKNQAAQQKAIADQAEQAARAAQAANDAARNQGSLPPDNRNDNLNSRLNNLEDALENQARQQRENERLNNLENALNRQMPVQKDPQSMLNDHAVEAAFNAQKMAQDLAQKQEQLKKEQEKFAEDLRRENEQMIKDTVEKTVDEKLQDIPELAVNKTDKSLGDENISETESTGKELETAEENGSPMVDEESVEEFITPEKSHTFPDIKTMRTSNDNYGDLPELKGEGESDSTDSLLEKIEKILSDPKAAVDYKDEIDLFKKLRILSKFLPESERDSFISCRMRVLIEYIISKMSGKPGLLITIESLLKSGALGSEYEKYLVDDEEPEPVSDKRIVNVLLTMRELSNCLSDKELVDSLKLNIDNVLEQIELADQKSQIF